MEDDVGSAVAASTKRVNSVKEDPTGKTGRDLREEIHNKIVKGQLLPPPKLSKPLPVPDSKPRRERGGRRLRKTKERYTITELRKLANIMQFALSEENALDGLGEGYGMYVQAGGGKLGESVGANNFNKRNYGSSGATSCLTSSLSFTPVQGVELSNAQARAHEVGNSTQDAYFSEMGRTLSKIKLT